MLPKITSLRQAKAIVELAAVHPIAGFDEHGMLHSMEIATVIFMHTT
jgi:hypothetical protein